MEAPSFELRCERDILRHRKLGHEFEVLMNNANAEPLRRSGEFKSTNLPSTRISPEFFCRAPERS